MEIKYCKECKYYRQHYTFSENKIVKIYCGHCTNRSARRRRPDINACEAFVLGDGEEVFASKEYLTKALLQRVLNMELLPPIEEAVSSQIR